MKKIFLSIVLCTAFIPHGVFALDSIRIPLQTNLIIERVNSEREARNLLPYKQNEALMRAAELKIQDIAKRSVLEHTKASADGLWWPLTSAGYIYESAGENLSEGVEDSSLLVSEWMNSPEHRANLLNQKYTEIGVAIGRGIFKGEEVTFVVLYSAKPKAPVGENQTLTLQTQKANTQPSPVLREIVKGETIQSNLEQRKIILKQLIALLTQYLNILIAQQQ